MHFPTPDWKYWVNNATVELWECVALSLDIDPEAVEYQESRGYVFWRKKEPKRRLDQLVRLVLHTNNQLAIKEVAENPPYISVNLCQFVHWAAPKWTPFPAALMRMVPAAVPHASKWPWGEYTNKNLDALVAAAQKFWSNGDSSKKSRTPKNPEVWQWLVKEYELTENIAKAVATIIRPEGAPKGNESRKGSTEKSLKK
jgi:hypothetical protein